MPEDVILTGRVLKWGNSYGIRLTKAELDRAGLAPGVEAVLRVRPGPVDVSSLPVIKGGKPDDSENIARLRVELARKKLASRQRGGRK